jgi:hypothetical protein
LAPRTLLRFIATMDPAESLSPSTAFPVFPVIRLPCSADFATGRAGFSSCLARPCHRAVPTTPPKLLAASVSCDDPYCLRLVAEGSTFGVIEFSRPPMGSLTLRPDDSLAVLTTALSIGFRNSVVGIELGRANCRWRVTSPALSVAGWVHSSTVATFPEAPL